MKKISLKTINNQEILSRKELKNIMGGFTGSGGGSGVGSSCSVTCKDKDNTKLTNDCGYGVSCSTDENNIYCDGKVAKTCP
ncbi:MULTISPECIES: hypothetical protein [Sphingobacterium]|uniref:hypothetical protein n=1 Tax=Sphingobacterium TaxID=28453 RepID=UPI00257F19C5|nr:MULTISPECIES: hypothetical protein [Sphingobacterium]